MSVPTLGLLLRAPGGVVGRAGIRTQNRALDTALGQDPPPCARLVEIRGSGLGGHLALVVLLFTVPSARAEAELA